MPSRHATDALFERYYFGRPGYSSGTDEFHRLCATSIARGGRILEVGAGPANNTTRFLAGHGTVFGTDVSHELSDNSALAAGSVFDGVTLPFASASFDGCVSNYVLEHVAQPDQHFREVARVLKPGGSYVIRTPNLFHYVTGASRLLPHVAHIGLAKWSRGQTDDDHDPWVTHYRANTPGRLQRLANLAGLQVSALRLVEKEPSYGRASPLLFYPMMLYERLVNATDLLASFRSSIVAVMQKPASAT